MVWQTMETFPYPEKSWDEYKHFLLYSPKCGIVVGYCDLIDEDEQDFSKRYQFRFDCDGYTIKPTHWMPLPPNP